jgi:phosphotransferase system enzyme I (PtsI)
MRSGYMLKGIGASEGVAMGKVFIVAHEDLNIEKIEIENTEKEEKRLLEAVENSKKQLLRVKEKAAEKLGEEEVQIFDAHLMVLEDPELVSSAVSKIKNDKVNSEFAFASIRDQFVSLFEAMDNEYMRERAADIKDVSNRVLRNLLGIKEVDLAALEEEVILVAHELTPSDTAVMNKDKVIGFLCNIGGTTSHTAIMARTLEIPAVVGLKDITDRAKDGDFVIFDGEKGDVFINPDEKTIEEYRQIKEVHEKEKEELRKLIGKETITLDGRHVELAGNIGTPDDIDGLLRNDAEGVGLFRTEFLYMNKDRWPTEEEQFESYKKVLEAMNPKPVVIRTLDIGGDKELSYLKMEKEMNPFLGYRAIRLCLDQKDIFRTQLRALLRASAYGKLRIMFPMISSLQELLDAKKVLEEVKAELDKEGKEYSNEIQVGMMIEVPSAAVISDILAKHVDFFSIGTNDLIQYTCAVDRMNEKIHNLYNPMHTAVLRLIKMVIDNGHKEGIWVGMCGEMAGNKDIIPILLGMGLDEFSMSPVSILPARKLITSLNHEDAKKKAEEVV